MMVRTSLVVTVALALGAAPARAQLTRSCRCVPFQQTLSVDVVPSSGWEMTTHTATYTVPSWAVFEIEAVSVRATPSAEDSMLVYALSLSTEVGGVRATHFNTPPVPAPEFVPGGGVSGGVLYAAYASAATSAPTAIYAGPRRLRQDQVDLRPHKERGHDHEDDEEDEADVNERDHVDLGNDAVLTAFGGNLHIWVTSQLREGDEFVSDSGQTASRRS
jgi:hypothetical protein